jgi:subtilase family serine protease
MTAVAALVVPALTAQPAVAYEKAQVLGRAPAERGVEFDIYIPLQKRDELQKLEIAQHTPDSALYHRWLTPAEFNARFAPDAATVAKVTKELAAAGLTVTEAHTHHLHVTGSVGAVERAFGAELHQAAFSGGKQVLAADRSLSLTPTLRSLGAVVPAFAGVIHMHGDAVRANIGAPENRESPVGGYWFDDLKQAYSYPSYRPYTGKGVTIGILMSAGYSAKDTKRYFEHEKLASPSITEIDINGAAPYDPNSPFNSAEVQLDIQQSGGMAPGASIIDYNLPDLYDDSILAGLTDIIEGSATIPGNVADVVNMSFGGPELGYSPAYNGGIDFTGLLSVYDDLFAQGNAQGITFVASAGDLGSNELPAAACFAPKATASCGSFVTTVNSPADSPHVTGVGGTNLVTTYDPVHTTDLNSAYVSEAAYGDPLAADIFYGTPATGGLWASGGGKSIYFTKPVWQRLVKTGFKTRTVPDVSLHMGGCPDGAVTPCGPNRSYDWVGLAGKFYGYIGTSASAPDFTGLTALKIEISGSRLGNENFEIYSLAAAQFAGVGPTVFRSDISGNNGVYSTHPGYNLVLGNGTIYGTQFVLIPSYHAAGRPQTPSNP